MVLFPQILYIIIICSSSLYKVVDLVDTNEEIPNADPQENIENQKTNNSAEEGEGRSRICKKGCPLSSLHIVKNPQQIQLVPWYPQQAVGALVNSPNEMGLVGQGYQLLQHPNILGGNVAVGSIQYPNIGANVGVGSIQQPNIGANAGVSSTQHIQHPNIGANVGVPSIQHIQHPNIDANVGVASIQQPNMGNNLGVASINDQTKPGQCTLCNKNPGLWGFVNIHNPQQLPNNNQGYPNQIQNGNVGLGGSFQVQAPMSVPQAQIRCFCNGMKHKMISVFGIGMSKLRRGICPPCVPGMHLMG